MCCMELLDANAISGQVTAVLALLLVRPIHLSPIVLIQEFLYYATQIMGYNNLKAFPSQSSPLALLDQAVGSQLIPTLVPAPAWDFPLATVP